MPLQSEENGIASLEADGESAVLVNLCACGQDGGERTGARGGGRGRPAQIANG